DGEILEELSIDNAWEVVRKIRDLNIESVAVCFINSYKNGHNELLMKDILEKGLPGVAISISYDVLPEIKEYERTCTTAVNAYLMPKVQKYINNLVTRKDDLGVTSKLHVMQSNGGIMSAEVAAQRSVHTVFSGPAGGVLGGVYISNLVGDENVITLDMGGTSTDIVLIHKGQIRLTTNGEIGNFPIKVPMIEMHTIGTGGGSIAWVDMGGTLRLGPESAGAMPGPACYGQEGKRPVVTDANLVLGRLDCKAFLGGEKPLYPEKAAAAIETEISNPLSLPVIEAAKGIIDISDANMCGGVKVISTQKGYDLREFSLISFGGAGSLHAARIARELNMKRVIVPMYPGNFSAIGAELAEVRYDYVRTLVQPVSEIGIENYNNIFHDIIQEAVPHLMEEGFKDKEIMMSGHADMRYEGQAWELSVGVPINIKDEAEFSNIINDFEEYHKKTYGYTLNDSKVTIVNLRLSATGMIPKLELKKHTITGHNTIEALKGKRSVYFDGKFTDTSIYNRDLLTPGNEIMGPAIIEEYASTIAVFPGDKASVDEYLNIIIERCD
ncbi:MAG: hydantoinase/oxoprolinase family protein, partial [Clostridiaceae bacterium]|nr:hydantoinase/oxoprolinase family protein [Clostridiaceae bacterium]